MEGCFSERGTNLTKHLFYFFTLLWQVLHNLDTACFSALCLTEADVCSPVVSALVRVQVLLSSAHAIAAYVPLCQRERWQVVGSELGKC